MPRLLNIQSSPNLISSASRAISKAFVEKYMSSHPNTELVDLDLAQNPPAHFGPDHFKAHSAPVEDHGPENTAALEASDAYVAQLLEADVLVIGTPMHNYGVSSTLKSWIDNVLRVGKTFRYTDTEAIGLVSGIRAVVVVSSGGIYSDGPTATVEHCANYLHDILAMIGLTDITILRAEGLALGPEAAKKALVDGIAEAELIAQ